MGSEAEFLDVIEIKVLKSFPPCCSQSPQVTDPPTPPPPPPSKSDLKLVYNGNIVYRTSTPRNRNETVRL